MVKDMKPKTGWQRNKPLLLEAVRLGVEHMLKQKQATKTNKAD